MYFDFIASFSQILSAFLMPKGSMWIAIGNDITCDNIGLTLNLDISCPVWYSLSISVYFLFVIKFEMDEMKIQKYIEPFLHGVPILYSLVINIYVFSIDYIDTDSTICWIRPP